MVAILESLPAGWSANSDGQGQLRLVSTADTPLAIVNGNQAATAKFQNADAIIEFDAAASGLAGELISVALEGLADDEPLSVSVAGNAISIVLEAVAGEIVSTAQDVADLINGDPDASALVSASVVNDGVLATTGEQFLTLPTAFTVASDGTVSAGGIAITFGNTQLLLGTGGVAISISGTSDADLFRAGPDDGGAWGLTKHGLEYFQAFDAGIDDGDVGDGERMQWFDDTSGDPAFRFKERDVDGTLHSGRAAAYDDAGDAFIGLTKPLLAASPTAAQISTVLAGLGLTRQT